MPFEVDFLPVGDSYGDAIVIRYGEDNTGYYLHVVDGGRTDTADAIIKHIESYYPNYHINHIVVSHADNDHACGLVGVMRRFKVKHLWMNRPWLYAQETLHHFHRNFTLQGLIDEMKQRHPYLVELEELAAHADLTRFRREAEKSRATNDMAGWRVAIALADQSLIRRSATETPPDYTTASVVFPIRQQSIKM